MVSRRGRFSSALLGISLSCVACGSEPAPDARGHSEAACPSRYVTSVESFSPGTGSDFGQAALPEIVFGPPKGGGDNAGSLDVVSLGNGGSITLGFAPTQIVDGPGPDFIVFENPFFPVGHPESVFVELATVEVSEDGTEFQAFPCATSDPPYDHCAGVRPVLANPDENTIDARDPNLAGGDAFDLAELGLSGARFVRITDRVDLAGFNGTFDLDAVSIVHAACP